MKLVPVRVSIKFIDSQKYLFAPFEQFARDTCIECSGNLGDTFFGGDATRKVYKFITVRKATSFIERVLSKLPDMKKLEVILEIVEWSQL